MARVGTRVGHEVLACAESYLILGIAFVAPPIKFTLKFRHREYLSPIFHLFSCYLPSIGKNEAIQLFRSLIFHAAMTGPLAPTLRSKILRLLLLHWRPDAIAEEVHCHFTTVYRFQENLFMYGSPFRSQFRSKGAPRKVFPAAEDSLLHTWSNSHGLCRKRWCGFYGRSGVYMFTGPRYPEF